MTATLVRTPGRADERVIVSGVSWEQYEALLAVFDDHPGVHLYYLHGELEILATSREHEARKSMLRRLVEYYAVLRQVDLRAFGSTTFREKAKERGAEPDECYVVARDLGQAPDIAIEVVITHGGLDKLAIYHGLGVEEVWFWMEGVLSIHRRGAKGYRKAARSRFLPDLDPALLARYVGREDQLAALNEFDSAIRRRA